MGFVIELKNVAKHYKIGDNVVKALDGVSIKINKGDFVAIMGPSGSGKSTGMNLTGSLDLPTKGTIKLEDIDIASLSESNLSQIRGKKIGFIFQSFNLISSLTALENVMLPMLFQNVEKEDRIERAEKLLKQVDLIDRANHYPNQLSGGQQQRVAIARALANNPDIILADEPTGNLDTKTGESVIHILKNLNDKGKTIIMITHEQELAKENAKKIYWLRDGKIEKITKKVGKTWKIIKE